ncbi:MAG TPA: hypothetical protein VGB70_08250 [Allosphingosinicella sp.]
MTWYRLYRWSESGIAQVWDLEADGEAQAVAQSVERLAGRRGELWQGKKLVERFEQLPA